MDRLEMLTNRAIEAESRANLLQAELERLREVRPDGSAQELKQRAAVAEERAEGIERELREVHYRWLERVLREPAESWFRPLESPYSAAPERAEEILQANHRLTAQAAFLQAENERLRQESAALQERLRSVAERPPAESQELQRLAYQDPLTGLPNLNLLERYLSNVTHLALLAVDVDGLRAANLHYGTAVGDEVLRLVAQRIQGQLRPDDVLARGRDDEFLIVVHGPPDNLPHMGTALAGRVLQAVAAPLQVGSHSVGVASCIGMVVGEAGDGRAVLLEKAHLALKTAKEAGRNQFHAWSSALEEKGRRRATLLIHLQRAIENDEFFLQFQPIIEVASQKMWGVEALLRWRHPDQGVLEPGKFLEAANESGLIVPIGEWVLREACALGAQLKNLHLSLNLSAREMLQADFVRRFTKALELAHVSNPERLVVEVREAEFVEDSDRLEATLKGLSRWRVGVAIDDFGLDALSIRRFKDFHSRYLKIDPSLVHSYRDPWSAGLCRAIVDMSAALQCQSWAEGVESAEQLQFLHSIGCKLAQGNFLCPPLSPGDLRERLKKLS